MKYLKNFIKLITTVVVLVQTIPATAQDAVFSQFYNASLYLNPALAGDESDIVLNMSHRSQWKKLHFPYTTSQVSLILPYYESKYQRPMGQKGGVGISMFNDRAGSGANFKTLGANISFAYKLPLSRNNTQHLTFALQPGFVQKRIDTDNLQWGEQYEKYVGFNNETVPADLGAIDNRLFFDISSGVFWRYQPGFRSRQIIRGAYSGLSVAHMNNPNESVLEGQANNLPVLYKYHGGLIFTVGMRSSISANVLSMIQDKENQTNFGSYYSYQISGQGMGSSSNIIARLGGWYRVKDSFIFNAELVADKFQIGFSYDWNVSSLRYNQRGVGAYEITFAMLFSRNAPPQIRY